MDPEEVKVEGEEVTPEAEIAEEPTLPGEADEVAEDAPANEEVA